MKKRLSKPKAEQEDFQTDDRRISEMRNLGPICERDFRAIGVLTAHDLIAIGPEEAFRQMLLGRKKLGRSTKCCNAAYLYAIYGAIHDLDWRKIPEQKKFDFKKLAESMRASGEFE
jgi:DNA transformation protein and related proteins